eukprot:g9300.t1
MEIDVLDGPRMSNRVNSCHQLLTKLLAHREIPATQIQKMYNRLGTRLHLYESNADLRQQRDTSQVVQWMSEWYRTLTGPGSRLQKRAILRAAANASVDNAATVARVFKVNFDQVETAIKQPDTAAIPRADRLDDEREFIKYVYYAHAVPSTSLQHFKWFKVEGSSTYWGGGGDEDDDDELLHLEYGRRFAMDSDSGKVLLQRYFMESSVKNLHIFYNRQVQKNSELLLRTVSYPFFLGCKPPNFVSADWRSCVCQNCLEMDMFCHALSILCRTAHRNVQGYATSAPNPEERTSLKTCTMDDCRNHPVRRLFLDAPRVRSHDTKFKLARLLLCVGAWSNTDGWDEKRIECAHGTCKLCQGQVSSFLPPCTMERQPKCNWQMLEKSTNRTGHAATFKRDRQGPATQLLLEASEHLRKWLRHMFEAQWTVEAPKQVLSHLQAAAVNDTSKLTPDQVATLRKTIFWAWDLAMSIELKPQDTAQAAWFSPRSTRCLTVEANVIRCSRLEREVHQFFLDCKIQDSAYVSLGLQKSADFIRQKDPAKHPRQHAIGNCDGCAEQNWSKYRDCDFRKLLSERHTACAYFKKACLWISVQELEKWRAQEDEDLEVKGAPKGQQSMYHKRYLASEKSVFLNVLPLVRFDCGCASCEHICSASSAKENQVQKKLIGATTSPDAAESSITTDVHAKHPGVTTFATTTTVATTTVADISAATASVETATVTTGTITATPASSTSTYVAGQCSTIKFSCLTPCKHLATCKYAAGIGAGLPNTSLKLSEAKKYMLQELQPEFQNNCQEDQPDLQVKFDLIAATILASGTNTKYRYRGNVQLFYRQELGCRNKEKTNGSQPGSMEHALAQSSLSSNVISCIRPNRQQKQKKQNVSVLSSVPGNPPQNGPSSVSTQHNLLSASVQPLCPSNPMHNVVNLPFAQLSAPSISQIPTMIPNIEGVQSAVSPDDQAQQAERIPASMSTTGASSSAKIDQIVNQRPLFDYLRPLITQSLDKNGNSLWVECPVLTYQRMWKEIVSCPAFARSPATSADYKSQGLEQ